MFSGVLLSILETFPSTQMGVPGEHLRTRKYPKITKNHPTGTYPDERLKLLRESAFLLEARTHKQDSEWTGLTSKTASGREGSARRVHLIGQGELDPTALGRHLNRPTNDCTITSAADRNKVEDLGLQQCSKGDCTWWGKHLDLPNLRISPAALAAASA